MIHSAIQSKQGIYSKFRVKIKRVRIINTSESGKLETDLLDSPYTPPFHFMGQYYRNFRIG